MLCESCGADNADGLSVCGACGRPLTSAVPHLTWRAPDGSPQAVALTRSFTVGRVAGSDIVIPDTSMSRQHGRFDAVNDQVAVVDLGSLNGVFVNDERIEEARVLEDGDLILLGRTLFSVSVPQGAVPGLRSADSLALDEASAASGEHTVRVDNWAEPSAESADRTMLATPADDDPALSADRTILAPADAEGVAEVEDDELASKPWGAWEDSDAQDVVIDQAAMGSEPPPEAIDESALGTDRIPAVIQESVLGTERNPAAPSVSSSFEAVVLEPAPRLAGFLVSEDIRTPLYERLTVGRSEGNDIRLENDRSVSRNHASIEVREDGIWLIDNGSANGTFADGIRISEPVLIPDRAEVKFGSAAFLFEAVHEPEPEAVAELDASETLVADVGFDDEPLPGATQPLRAVEQEEDWGDRTLQGSDADLYIKEAELDELRALRAGEAEAPPPASVAVVDQYHLVVNFGPEAGRQFPLSHEVTVIGRSAPDVDFEIQLDDRAISRPHAKLVREQDGYAIYDLDSANGTWLNYTEEIKGPRKLQDGDIVKVGKTTLVYRLPSSARPKQVEVLLDPTVGRILTVFSLKGGVGTTAVAVNVAVLLKALTGQSVLLVDLSTERGAVSVHLNLTPRLTLADLPSDPSMIEQEALDSVVAKHSSGVDVLASPASPQAAELVTPSSVAAILPLAKARYKWIVVDTSAAFSELNLGVFDQSDLLLLVFAPDLTSVKVTQSALDVFAALQTSAEKRVLVLNHTHPRTRLSAADLENTLGERIGLVIPYADDLLLDSIDRGVPLAETARDHPSVAAMAEFVAKLAQVKVEAETQQRRGGLGRWVQGLITSIRR